MDLLLGCNTRFCRYRCYTPLEGVKPFVGTIGISERDKINEIGVSSIVKNCGTASQMEAGAATATIQRYGKPSLSASPKLIPEEGSPPGSDIA